jgi:RNA polymerase sigma-70 factor (ECF subfamily)
MSDEELIRACAESNDGAAWCEFVRRFQCPISLSILRVSYKYSREPRQILDDLVQETYLKLCANRCRHLLRFAIAHPDQIVGYIKTVAANVAHDHFKSLNSQKKGGGKVQESLSDIDPEADAHGLGGEAEIEERIRLKEIDDCAVICTAGPDQERDLTIFRLRYRQGWTAKEIAALPTIELTEEGVESVIHRVTRAVRERMIPVPPGMEE